MLLTVIGVFNTVESYLFLATVLGVVGSALYNRYWKTVSSIRSSKVVK